MGEIIIPYKPRQAFKAYHETDKRFSVRVVHRRGGKTTATINNKIKRALEDPVKQLAKRGILPSSESEKEAWRGMPRMYPLVLPQLKQAKSIAWGPLKFYSKKIPGIKINESELSVTFPGNGVVRLFGSGPQESEAFRGMKLWDCDFDEYQDCDPNVWHEIVRPACLDTQAPVGFAGTIKGKNHLWRLFEQHKDDPEWFTLWLQASQSGIIPPEILAKEREQYEKEGKLAKFMQEFELEPMAIIEGAIFGKEYLWLKENNRIVPLHYEPSLKVDTYWDLGIADYLVVLFVQRIGLESRIIDCIATHGESLPEVAEQIQKKPYRYGKHYLPHDANVRELQTGISRTQALQDLLSGEVEVVSRIKAKEDAISSVRAVYRRLWINSALEVFLDAFAQYEYDFDEERKVFLSAPKHNWCSHLMDALMGWSQVELSEFKEGEYPRYIPQRSQNNLYSPI